MKLAFWLLGVFHNWASRLELWIDWHTECPCPVPLESGASTNAFAENPDPAVCPGHPWKTPAEAGEFLDGMAPERRPLSENKT